MMASVTVTVVTDHIQQMIDYKIAEARFIQQWVGRPLKRWLFKQRYERANAALGGPAGDVDEAPLGMAAAVAVRVDVDHPAAKATAAVEGPMRRSALVMPARARPRLARPAAPAPGTSRGIVRGDARSTRPNCLARSPGPAR